MFDTPKRHHRYDTGRIRKSVRNIWQGGGRYHAVFLQVGNSDWVGYWSSDPIGKLVDKDALEEFLEYATHVVDNARKLGMIDERPVEIYGFHDAQMKNHHGMLGIPDVRDGNGSWMKVTHRHPFVPDSYTRMSEFDEFGEMDFSDLAPELQKIANSMNPDALRRQMGFPEDATIADMVPMPMPDDEPMPKNEERMLREIFLGEKTVDTPTEGEPSGDGEEDESRG